MIALLQENADSGSVDSGGIESTSIAIRESRGYALIRSGLSHQRRGEQPILIGELLMNASKSSTSELLSSHTVISSNFVIFTEHYDSTTVGAEDRLRKQNVARATRQQIAA